MNNFIQTFGAMILSLLLMIGITMVIYYFTTYRGIKARRQHFEVLHQSLAPGQKVEFAGGLIGVIRHVGLEICEIEVKSGAMIEVSRYAISGLVEQ